MIEDRHPEASVLLAFRLGELGGTERSRLQVHVEACEPCSSEIGRLTDTLAALEVWADEEPPSDGLARLLAAVGPAQPPTALAPRSEGWLQPVLLSLAGVLAGGLAIYAGGAAVALPSEWLPSLLRPLQAVSGFALAGLAFFGAGSLLTLALAPMLILERQGPSRLAAR